MAPVEPSKKEDGRKLKKIKRDGGIKKEADPAAAIAAPPPNPALPEEPLMSPRDILENSTCLSTTDRAVLDLFFDESKPKDASLGTKNFKITEGVRVGEDGVRVKEKEYLQVNWETGDWSVLRKSKPVDDGGAGA